MPPAYGLEDTVQKEKTGGAHAYCDVLQVKMLIVDSLTELPDLLLDFVHFFSCKLIICGFVLF